MLDRSADGPALNMTHDRNCQPMPVRQLNFPCAAFLVDIVCRISSPCLSEKYRCRSTTMEFVEPANRIGCRGECHGERRRGRFGVDNPGLRAVGQRYDIRFPGAAHSASAPGCHELDPRLSNSRRVARSLVVTMDARSTLFAVGYSPGTPTAWTRWPVLKDCVERIIAESPVYIRYSRRDCVPETPTMDSRKQATCF